MRILVSWLREFVDVTAPPAELATTLSMRGFEVAAIEEPPAGPLQPAGARAPATHASSPAPAGQGFSPAQDAVIDLEITANRPDCLSVVGIAREVATAYNLPLKNLPGARLADAAGAPDSIAGLDVVLEDAELCPRYAAAVADVKIGASPAWLANRLEAAGVRPINNVVDVTNYVLIELGHPMHAFDLDRLARHTLVIRRARPGEMVQTLDGVDRTLEPDMLVIADAERAQAIAGVMGGAGSEVWAGTRAVAFESACFKPTSVRRTSKRLGLKTEASARFERGADIRAPVVALRRAGELLETIGAGRARPGIIDRYPSPRLQTRVAFRRARIAHLLGRAVDDETVLRIFGGLDLVVEPAPDGWLVTVPTARVDIAREEDLIEEVARHVGYDLLPATFPPLRSVSPSPDPRIARDRLLRHVLTGAGASEAITFAFIEAEAAAPFAEGSAPVALAYPLSEKFAVLRPSLLPGLVDAIAYNRRREQRDVRLFEIGTRFFSDREEARAVAVAWIGDSVPEHWSGGRRPVDFHDIKGIVERLCDALAVVPRFERVSAPFLVDGRAAAVRSGDVRLGTLGQLAPSIAQARGLPPTDDVYVAEIYLDAVDRVVTPRETHARPLPRFPSVVRDLSIVVDETLPAGIVRGTILAAAPDMLVQVREFDRYKGKGIPEGRISLSFHLTFRSPERTLTDAEVQHAMDAIVAALAETHGAVQR